MKFPLLFSAALLLLAPMAVSAAAPSPVGTWEVTLAGADQGTAYVTFEDDKDFTAYGVSAESYGVFTISGTWSVDEKGALTASYDELINGSEVTGAISGKVTASKISGKIAATNGNFTFKAIREKVIQDLTGTWTGIAQLGKLRLPEIYQILPTELPHVFEITGGGISPTGGSFQISGTAIAGSANKVRLFALSQYPGGSYPGVSNLSGTVDASKTKGTLKGFESTGQAIKISLQR